MLKEKWGKSQKENGGYDHISLNASKKSSRTKEGYNNIIQMDYLIFLQKIHKRKLKENS